MNKKSEQIKNLNTIELLSLISAAAVMRKYDFLKLLMKESALRKIRTEKIYEALLQTYLFAGFPSALNSLKIFKENFPEFISKNKPISDVYSAGAKTCKKIYGNKFEKLKSNINSFSPEMAEWFISEGYGKVLSRKNLSLKERELCIVSILSVLKFDSQLFSHINGACRQKAGISEIEKIISNLDLLPAKSASKFGMMVLESYKQKINAR